MSHIDTKRYLREEALLFDVEGSELVGSRPIKTLVTVIQLIIKEVPCTPSPSAKPNEHLNCALMFYPGGQSRDIRAER